MRCLALLLATLSAAPAAAGGGTTADTMKRVAQTERVAYFGRSRGDVDVKGSEKLLDRLEDVFGRMPRGVPLQYYRHASSAGVRDQVGFHAVGVTDIEAGRIDSTLAYHPHELVHAVAGRLGRPPLFFEEGLAVAMTSRGRWGTREVDTVARRALASGVRLGPFLDGFADQDPELGYPLAGSFVAYLLDVHGIGAVRSFLAACAAPSQRHETAFQRAFGRTVAGATSGWRAALARGEAATWRWAEPSTWPASLQRDEARAAAVPAIARADEPAIAEGSLPDRSQAVSASDLSDVAAER